MFTAVIVIAVACISLLAAAFSLSSEFVAWSCVGLSAIGLIVMIVDGRRQRQRKNETVSDGEHSEPGRHAAGGVSFADESHAEDREVGDGAIASTTAPSGVSHEESLGDVH